MKIKSLLFLSFFISISTAWAWNGTGHRIVGAIAYYSLKQASPGTLEKAITILKQHPWYLDETKWPTELNGVSKENIGVVLFMLAATWPDDIKVRGNTYEPKNKEWHFIDNPYVKPGSAGNGVSAKSPNAYDAYNSATNILSSNSSDGEKAIALAWMLHIIGDVHQPLHCISMFADNIAHDGDKGGNLLCVNKESKTVNLHSFWDDLFGEGKKPFNTCISKAQELILTFPENTLTELKQNTSIQDWVTKESYPIAIESVYLKGTLAYAIRASMSEDCPIGPKLPQSYIDNATKIASKRVTLAGIRLRDYIIRNIK